MKAEKITELIYEAARLEAIWSKRSIVPEKWEKRDKKFRKQMIEIVRKYLSMKQLPIYDLPKDERDKDAIFLVLVWLAKYLGGGI